MLLELACLCLLKRPVFIQLTSHFARRLPVRARREAMRPPRRSYAGCPPTSATAAASDLILTSVLIDELFRFQRLRSFSWVKPTSLGCGCGHDSLQPSRIRGRALRTPEIPPARSRLVIDVDLARKTRYRQLHFPT